jgi:hypothetical protein
MAASKPTSRLSSKPYFLLPLSAVSGTLAGNLGCFPLVRERYRPRTNCQGRAIGIRSLVGTGSLESPRAHSVALPPMANNLTSSRNLFRGEPAIRRFG